MDSNLVHLGIFMVTGLKFLAQIVKGSQENDNFLQPQINDFIRRNEAFDISIKIDGPHPQPVVGGSDSERGYASREPHIIISYKGIFICRVNVMDYS